MYGMYLKEIEKLDVAIADYEYCFVNLKKIKNELEQTTKLKTLLLEKYRHKFVNILEMPEKKYSQAEIEAIKTELFDSSFWTVIKRLLGIGKKQEEIYAELMGKIKGLTLYLQNEVGNSVSELNHKEQCIRRVATRFNNDYQGVIEKSGGDFADKWATYESSNDEDKVLYWGDVDVFLESEKKESVSVLQEVLGKLYQDEFVRVPYIRDYSEPFMFYCEYSGESAKHKANGLVRSIIYQNIRQMSDYETEIHLIDGDNTGNDFSELLGLKQIRENEVWELNTKITKNVYKYAQVYLNNQDISQGLKNLDQYIGKVAEETAGFRNVREYNESETAEEKGRIPHQIVVIQNFPMGFNENDIELLNKLIKNGEQRGISIFIEYDYKYKAMFKEKVDTPTKNLLDGFVIEESQERIIAKDCSSVIRLQCMEEGKRDYIQSLIDEKTKAKKVDNRFSSIFGIGQEFGTKDATKGIFVPFAVDKKGGIKEFTLAQALNAHALISGGTGSGKTSLLHMIISSICMNYTPKDVELWLIDYKITEFSSYKYNTPPHVTFLGLSKGMDFTYALIDKAYEEYERRQQLIKEADEEKKRQGESVNITSISDYRKYYGKNSMSRLLIIVDEFHVMAQQVNEDSDYKEKLENLLAEGRAMGITFMFSDQAITVGLKGLTDKGRKQIKCRLAMANDEEEMKEMLQEKSTEAIQPLMTMDTGECALITFENVRSENGELVEHKKIERVQTIYIDGETRFELCKKIRVFYGEESYIPVYMDETEIKSYNNEEITQWNEKHDICTDASRQVPIYMGEALNLTGCFMIPLLRRRGENVMNVGGTEEEQIRLILSAIKSFQRIENHEIVIISDPYSSLFTMYEKIFVDLQKNDSAVAVYSDIREICRQINDLLYDIADKTKGNRKLVIWIGLEDMYEEFQSYPEEKPKSYQDCLKKKTRISSEELRDDLSAKWDALFGEEFFGDSASDFASFDNKVSDEEDFEEEETDGLYNAIEDIVQILHAGPRQGVFNYVNYDTTYPIRNNRKIKVEDFKHKLAFSMGRDECGDYLGRTMLLDGLEKQKGVAAYYDGKIRVNKFVPYSLKR